MLISFGYMILSQNCRRHQLEASIISEKEYAIDIVVVKNESKYGAADFVVALVRSSCGDGD